MSKKYDVGNFKIGDRVRCIKEFEGNDNIVDKEGVVKVLKPTQSGCIGVEFDEEIDGHDLQGYAKDRRGWWLPPDHLLRLEEDGDQDFAVGDIVKAKKIVGFNDVKAVIGIVRKIGTHEFPIGVEFFGDKMSGHSLDGSLEKEKGWWCSKDWLEKIDAGTGEFRTGDIVEMNSDDYSIPDGRRGVVIWGGEDTDSIGVAWDDWGDGHDLRDIAKTCGWFVDGEDLRLIKRQAGQRGEQERKDASPRTPEPQPILPERYDIRPPYRYIARDKDGKLFAYETKPVRDLGGRQWFGKPFKKIKDEYYPSLKWEDEPIEII